MVSLLTKHKDRIAGKGVVSLTHCNLVHKFIPMPQALRIPNAKAAVDKEWKQLETIPAWQLEKVKSKKKVTLQSTKGQKESPLCYIDSHMSPQKRGVRTQSTKIQRQSRAPW